MSAHTMLRRVTGLNLTHSTVERAVRQRMAERDLSDPDSYLQALTADELTQLIELVVVPESWLFRDAAAFVWATRFVQERMLGAARPNAARPSAARPSAARPIAARPIRILSIPCACGEEPYSMAMALRDAGIPDQAYTIDAVDLSASCIARAERGIYGRNAFRSQDMGFRARHFTHLGGDQYRIIDSLRAQVRFRQGNLLHIDTLMHAHYYDVIFCRNLLIYFDQTMAKAAISRLAAILDNDGFLFAGYAEVPTFCRHGFVSLPQRQAFALKKNPGLPARPPLPLPTPPPLARAIKPRAKPVARAAAENLLEQAGKLADLGRFEEAGLKCLAHLSLVPDAAGAYFILGILSEHAKQKAAAESHWRRCLYLQPDHYEALCHLAVLTEQHGNAAGAAALKARAARIFNRQQATWIPPQYP